MRFVLGGLLAAMVLSPFAPFIYNDESHRLTGSGAYFYYLGTPAIFAVLFVNGLIRYRRFLKEFRDNGEVDVKASSQPK